VAVAPGGSTFTGVVGMQGRASPPHASWVTPLVFTVHEPGQAAALATFAVTTTNDGRFIVTGVPTGTFDLKLKGLHTLRNLLQDVAIGMARQRLTLERCSRVMHNDNTVNALDLSVYSGAAGTSAGQPGFDGRADFNNDGSVNASDLSLLTANFGRSGDISDGGAAAPAWAELGASVAASATGLAAGTVSLSLLPASNSLVVGQMLTLTLQVQAGAQPLDSIEVHINLPPGLAVVTPDGAPSEIIESSYAGLLEAVNVVNNAAGTIDYAAVAPGDAVSGTFTLATIRLKAGRPLADATFALPSNRDE